MKQRARFCELNPVIPVRDMTATLAFYEQKLGFKKVFYEDL